MCCIVGNEKLGVTERPLQTSTTERQLGSPVEYAPVYTEHSEAQKMADEMNQAEETKSKGPNFHYRVQTFDIRKNYVGSSYTATNNECPPGCNHRDATCKLSCYEEDEPYTGYHL
jgi:hypothetical protein